MKDTSYLTEDQIESSISEYSHLPEINKPEDKSYLECDLPPILQDSIKKMQEAWRKVDSGEQYNFWDCDFCELQSDINNAEVNQVITPEQAWHLRYKYLRMKKDGEIDESY